jgi:acetyltransferase
LRPHLGINATFGKTGALPGSLALVSQSGALCTAILDSMQGTQVGFSAVVSVGDMADIELGDLLDFLALDQQTHSILLYVEGIRNARAFLSGLRAATRLKPVVVVKAGRHAQSSRAALSHTGSMVGGDDAFDAALRRAGAVRATTIEQLFAAAQVLAGQRKAAGGRLAIVTNAGGPGVLATDRAVDLGIELAELTAKTMAALRERLPEQWSHGNPVDILGDAQADRYAQTLSACLADSNVDGVLVMLTPQAMTDPLEVARAVVDAARGTKKPVLACWMGGASIESARRLFTDEGIASLGTPETAVEAFYYLSSYRKNQELLLQVPEPLSYRSEPDLQSARMIIEGALAEERRVLTTSEAKAMLAAFGIPTTQVVNVTTPSDALVAATSLGYPVAMKIDSPDIPHKSDVNGVRLDVRTAADVRRVFVELTTTAARLRPDARIRGVTIEPMHRARHGRELIVGAVRDSVFGPVIGFGAGGTAVEVMRDRAVALPPLNTYIVKDLIARTRASKLLGAFRNMPPARYEAIEQIVLKVSDLVSELPEVVEIELNPLSADERGAVALDARVVVEPLTSRGRYSHMAIHPYPSHLSQHVQLGDGTDVTIRPIRPEDAHIEQDFVRSLSPQARYFRFMQSLSELTKEMLIRFTQIDYDREMALVAVTDEEGTERQIGVGRYVTNPDGLSSEFAVVVADDWQRRGIGKRLILALMESAKTQGLRTFEGEVLTSNAPMLGLMKSLGFELRPVVGDPSVHLAVREL